MSDLVWVATGFVLVHGSVLVYTVVLRARLARATARRAEDRS